MYKAKAAIFGFNLLLIVHSIEINLKDGWHITNANGSMKLTNQSLPSGIYSALEEANLTGSILQSYNDVNLRWIGNDNWTYSTMFDAPTNVNNFTGSVLVFHGIDTNAHIYLNDLLLGRTDNMFVRYRYNIKNCLKATNNTLRVEITSPILVAMQLSQLNKVTPPKCPSERCHGECHINFLRKMQASFSWDWGLTAPSIGLWKPVRIEIYESAIIRDVTYYLEDKQMWIVHLTIYFESGVNNKDSLSVEGNLMIELKDVFATKMNKTISATPDENGEFSVEASFQVPKEKVKLWWPNGYGSQTLYTLIATWEGTVGRTDTNKINSVHPKFMISAKSIRIGFRTIELVEEPIDSGLSFYLKVNKLPMFMKGTNWIPSHILPEKSADKSRLDFYMKSLQDTHMNMIRVWGGGVYESDYFYDIADEHGILIWQDMMFACSMYPVFDEFLTSVREEIKQNIRRLQSHPSIAIWAGNNENEEALRENWYGTSQDYDRFADEYIKLYDGIIATEVLKNDKWHIWLYSSPSNGIHRSNASIIQQNPQDWHYGDIHFYNYIADGWNPSIYPRPRFVSEYGFQSIPSLNSWKSVLNSADYLGELINHRQHFQLGSGPVLDLIHKNLPILSENDTMYLEALIYFSQISQAMTIKTETETYRIQQDGLMKTMGALYWQLNDVWVAPSWSSIEFNGNYKILHHFAKKFFAPTALAVFVDITNRINVHIIRDVKSVAETYRLCMKIYKWSSLEVQYEHTWNYTTTINRSVENVARIHLDTYLTPPLTKYNSVIEFVLLNGHDDNIISTNFILPSKVKDAIGLVDPKLKVENIHYDNNCNEDGHQSLVFDIIVEAPALFVYIQINHDTIDRYVLSDNGFIQFQRNHTISLKYADPTCSTFLSESNIHVLTVNKFMYSGVPSENITSKIWNFGVNVYEYLEFTKDSLKNFWNF